MKQQYYKLPMDFSRILQKQDLPDVNLEESVGQHIQLLITTVLGENKDDPQYGCQLWDSDFDIRASNNEVKEQVELSIRASINRYEKRLTQTRVVAQISQEELMGVSAKKVKKKIRVTVTGVLARNKTEFHYSSFFYVSPLSYD
ncbi:GPW/gp25 family protein [Chitinophaga sancti]|uniref:GPW/gp25 family protein n=2 Tax=Chitinophaga sancti TaxID=1004 RepID=A0ABZ0XPB0_9BACT|nr:GPW/gp25 family protein [Chitinophaga sancti]WQD61906.1 GPW/gp25 family protein [Chitinophaga sancti]WQG92525.1 GPW/gp25 family protein [Chitinophaga sancti]